MQCKGPRATTNYKGILALTTVGAFSKIVSVLFKIIIIYIIGTIGIGYYQLAFPLFVFSYTLASVGNATSLTMFVAGESSSKNGGIIKYAVVFSGVISGVVAMLIALFCKPIAILQGNENLYVVYLGVAVCIVAVSILSTYRGAVRGFRLITKYAISDCIEQASKLLLSVLFAYLLMPSGLIYAVLGVFLGISCSAVIASIYTIAVLKVHQKGLVTNNNNIDVKRFWIFTILSCITSLILPLTQFIDSTLIVRLLEHIGYSHIYATKLFGLSRGTVSSLINLPNSAFIAIELLLLPDLVKLKAEEFTKKSQQIIIITTFLVSLFCATFLLFSNEILSLIYGAKLDKTEFDISLNLLKIGAVSIFFSGLSQIQSTILQGKKMLYLPIISLVVASVCKLAFEVFLIPNLGIVAVELSFVMFYVVICLLNSIFMCYKNLDFGSTKNLLALILGFGIITLLRLLYLLYAKKMNYIFAIILAGASVVLIICMALVFVTQRKKQRQNNNF